MKTTDANDLFRAAEFAYAALAIALVEDDVLDPEVLAAHLGQATGLLRHRGETAASDVLERMAGDLVDQIEDLGF